MLSSVQYCKLLSNLVNSRATFLSTSFNGATQCSQRCPVAETHPQCLRIKMSKVNIASLGVQQIQKRIASSGFSKTVDIQVEALKKAKESNAQGRWWIKADACDVRKACVESGLVMKIWGMGHCKLCTMNIKGDVPL